MRCVSESRVLKPPAAIVLFKMFALYKTRRKGRQQTTGLPFVFNFPTKTVPPIEKWVRWCHLRLDGAATFARPNEMEPLSASKHCNVYWNANSSLIIPVFANICFCRVFIHTHTHESSKRAVLKYTFCRRADWLAESAFIELGVCCWLRAAQRENYTLVALCEQQVLSWEKFIPGWTLLACATFRRGLVTRKQSSLNWIVQLSELCN